MHQKFIIYSKSQQLLTHIYFTFNLSQGLETTSDMPLFCLLHFKWDVDGMVLSVNILDYISRLYHGFKYALCRSG